MSSDNGIYVLGPLPDGTFRVAYCQAVENIGLPTKDDPRAKAWTKEVFHNDYQRIGSIKDWRRPVYCKDIDEAWMAAGMLYGLYSKEDDGPYPATLEYGVSSLGPYEYFL